MINNCRFWRTSTGGLLVCLCGDINQAKEESLPAVGSRSDGLHIDNTYHSQLDLMHNTKDAKIEPIGRHHADGSERLPSFFFVWPSFRISNLKCIKEWPDQLQTTAVNIREGCELMQPKDQRF